MQNRMITNMLLAFAWFSVMGYFGLKNVAKICIKDINIIWDYYPHKYIIPPKCIRKQFKLEKKEILKYFYFQLLMADMSLVCLAIYILVYFLSGFNYILAYKMFYVFVFALGMDMFVMLIKIVWYQRKRKQQRNREKTKK